MNILPAFSATIFYWFMTIGMPSVYYYHMFTDNLLINHRIEEAEGLEKIADFFLAPNRYLFSGKKARELKSGRYLFDVRQESKYTEKLLWHKTAISIIAWPIATITGGTLKIISLSNPKTKDRYNKFKHFIGNPQIASNRLFYEQIGLKATARAIDLWLQSQNYQREPGAENLFEASKEALQAIAHVLERHQIPFWLDCGSCLGAYRYGGVIPWDNDIDIAILQADFTNVKNALKALDPNKFVVQDWSSRDRPETYLKVYVKKSRELIDIYNYAIDVQSKKLYTIISNEHCIFLPKSWKIRERYCATPVDFDVIFPLKKATFDGVEVYVPNKTQEFLQSKYGENLAPAKIYNPITKKYDKDLSHPYWQRLHVH